MAKYDSISSELGKDDFTGDPEDQTLLLNRKIAKATSPNAVPLASMLKTAAKKRKKKSFGNS